MATYRGRLALDRPYQGVMATIYNSNNVRVSVDVTDHYGFYVFENLQTGPHKIKFFGRNYSPNDDIDVSVVDEFDAGASAPLTFFTPPELGVVEGVPYSNYGGNEGSEANFTLTNLQPETGILG